VNPQIAWRHSREQPAATLGKPQMFWVASAELPSAGVLRQCHVAQRYSSAHGSAGRASALGHSLRRPYLLRTEAIYNHWHGFWFLVCNTSTQLEIQLPQRSIQVVRSNKVARKRLTESNGTPTMDLGHMNIF